MHVNICIHVLATHIRGLQTGDSRKTFCMQQAEQHVTPRRSVRAQSSLELGLFALEGRDAAGASATTGSTASAAASTAAATLVCMSAEGYWGS
jgi:hypothetical protein